MSLTSFFTDIASAIRAKDGTTANIAASAFPERIRAIQTGVDTGDATAVASDILSGKTAYVNGEKVTGTIPSQGGAAVTPGTTAKTAVAAGRYTTGDVTVAGDANLKAGNIKKGVSIFGVSGSFAASFEPDIQLIDSVIAPEGSATITFQLPDFINPEKVFGIALLNPDQGIISGEWWWAMKGDVWYGCANSALGGKRYVEDNVEINGNNITMLLCYGNSLRDSVDLHAYVFHDRGI